MGTGGGFAIVTGTVTVNAPPSAALRVSSANPFVGEAVTISSTAVDPDGPITSHNWDLDGDGQFDDAAGAVVSKTYSTAGRRTVQLRVTDSKGAVATASGVVDVRTRPLTVLSGFTIDIKGSLSGSFTRLKRLSVQAPAGAIVMVKCKGKDCPKAAKSAIKRSKGRAIRFKVLEKRLRAGTKVIVTATKTGFIGKQATFTMRSGKEPKRVNRCLLPGAKRATTCPA